jgi:hypothetical protein
MQKLTPFLWFDNQAEEAVKFSGKRARAAYAFALGASLFGRHADLPQDRGSNRGAEGGGHMRY